ncbi:MAG TPA: hypothetical protein VF251_03080, partial [Pyrinomonadaceae bacterium]
MKKQTSTILASVLCFILVAITHSTIAQQVRTSQSNRGSVWQPKAKGATAQERVVREIYSKLTSLNRASNNLTITDNSLDGSKVIKFELSNFHIGPIGEILSKPHSEFITGFEGEIIDVAREVNVHNKGPEHVSFGAQWNQGQYASGYEAGWSVAQIFAFYPDEYYDIGSYATYEVTVTLQERSRHYKAMALFSKDFDQHNEITPRFWDNVVGSGGSLNRILDERRPPREPRPSSSPLLESKYSSPHKSSALSAELASGGEPPEPVITEPTPQPVSITEGTEAGFGDLIVRTTDDRKEHLDGWHGETVGFQGQCTFEDGWQEGCVVNTPLWNLTERGTSSRAFFVHVSNVAQKDESATGPRNSTITCSAARGMAVSSCLFGACNVIASFTGVGTEVRMTGGNLWNGELVHKHSCRVPGGGTGCTTRGIDDSCPPGTVPDGFGMCCTRLIGDGDECQVEFLRCHRSLGIFDGATCDCVPLSPIV